jgi:hypothetical protein
LIEEPLYKFESQTVNGREHSIAVFNRAVDDKDSIVSKIKARTTYGERYERVTGTAHIIVFSNNDRSWFSYRRAEPIDTVICLDSDQILVYLKPEDLKEFISELPDIPLYKRSFEARTRGAQNA